MAFNFSANQFQKEFASRRLCNWQIPRGISGRPRARQGPTRIIANDRGHLLPGAPRAAPKPQDQFLSTWKLPRKISRQYAESRCVLRPLVRGGCYRPEDTQIIRSAKFVSKGSPLDQSVPKVPQDEPCMKQKNSRLCVKEENENMLEKCQKYIPGDLTEAKHRPDNYEVLRARKPVAETVIQSPPRQRVRSGDVLPSPLTLTKRNFALARRCARENLEHQPLPDTVSHAGYRRRQMANRGHDTAPGLALPETSLGATGVAWKQQTGPTHCTKMHIFRPGTAVDKRNLKANQGGGRASSCDGSFDLKWRFIKQKNATPIELAICWDKRPEDPRDEPRRASHIDGTNGSVAPAVFAMVQSPKEPLTTRSASARDPGHSYNEPPLARTARPATSGENARRRSASTDSLYVNVTNKRKCSRNTVKTAGCLQKQRREMYQSSPNLSNAASCNSDWSRAGIVREVTPAASRSEYKMAFKAGVPRDRSHSQDSSSGGSTVHVPKQRDPYAKRNYDIKSLSPPFSLWNGTSCHSYPDHWRLASVYQHSYKPLEARRKHLLAAVYQ